MDGPVVGQPQFLKEVNLHIINSLIIEKGPLTKPQLSTMTGLSLPTVNKIVDILEKQNKVYASGMAGQSVGRKAKLYSANGSEGNVLALYISQRNCLSCVVNMLGEVIYRFSFQLEQESDPTVALQEAVRRLLENCTAAPLAIGIAVPGVVDDNAKIFAIDSIPQWEGYDLKTTMEKTFGLPVTIENNARLTAIGFYNSCCKKDYKDMVYLHMGSGISAGIILNSLLYKGFRCFAGEAGYMYPTGGLEQGAAPGQLEKEVGQLLETLQNESRPEKIAACKEKLMHHMCHIIVNLICLLNPQVIVLRGTVVSSDLVQELGEAVRRYIPDDCMPKLVIDSSELSGIKGILNVCRQQISPAYNIVVEHKV